MTSGKWVKDSTSYNIFNPKPVLERARLDAKTTRWQLFCFLLLYSCNLYLCLYYCNLYVYSCNLYLYLYSCNLFDIPQTYHPLANHSTSHTPPWNNQFVLLLRLDSERSSPPKLIWPTSAWESELSTVLLVGQLSKLKNTGKVTDHATILQKWHQDNISVQHSPFPGGSGFSYGTALAAFTVYHRSPE